LTSRYNQVDEYEEMQRVVLLLPAKVAACIRSMFCDSKATRCYDVVLRYDTRTWDANLARYCVGKRLEAALVVVVGGHNGISIEAADRQCGDTHNRVYLDPAWPGFWPYDDDANANA